MILNMALKITGGWIFDPVAGSNEENPGIYMEGQYIKNIGGSQGDAPISDAGNCYLMPGLIDAHVHLIWNSSPDPDKLIIGKPDSYITHVAANATIEVDFTLRISLMGFIIFRID